jgi:predicted oxidoreductase
VTGLRVEAGKVTGVLAENLRTGEKSAIIGGAVLLSTGGFGANLDLVRASWPRSMPLPERVLVGGGFFALGGGMDLAKAAGGVSSRLDHQWNYASGLPDPFDPESKRGFFTAAPGAIWVNAQGKRFVLEQHEPKATIPVIAAQNPARFWAIFDAQGRKTFRVVHAGFTQDRVEALFDVPGFIVRAESLEGLARAAELPADSLRATVERYNSLVEAGEDSDFGRFGSKAPPRGYPVLPRKIAEPPFYAAPQYILIRKSMGGIHVDTSCRVLNEAGEPAPGLLAAGEATGFGGVNGRHGLEGTFLGPCILMGRVAAQTVARDAGPRTPAVSTITLRSAPPAVSPKLASSCTSCHQITKLVAAKRAGYWHFEHVHRRVLARNLNCTGCHAEMAPFRPAAHKIDPQLQAAVCQYCHMSEPGPGRFTRAE